MRCAQPVQYREGGSKVRRLSPHALHMFSSVLSMGAKRGCPADRQTHQMAHTTLQTHTDTHTATDTHFQGAGIRSACGALLRATWVHIAANCDNTYCMPTQISSKGASDSADRQIQNTILTHWRTKHQLLQRLQEVQSASSKQCT